MQAARLSPFCWQDMLEPLTAFTQNRSSPLITYAAPEAPAAIADLRHVPHLERPEMFAQAVLSFLSS